MRSPYQRRNGFRLSLWQFLLLVLGIVLLVLGWDRLTAPLSAPAQPEAAAPAPAVTPTLPEHLTAADVLPTPTVDPNGPQRFITFPGARTTARIILAARTQASWETRYLGSSVGHLQGTAWLDDPGGNVVLAGHVTDAFGQPGPFAYLFEAQIGDDIILTEDSVRYTYRVTAIEEADPEDIEYVMQDGDPRLTLITCDDWNFDSQTYDHRMILIAEPIDQSG